MKCSSCESGNMRVKYSTYEKGIFIRNRVCDSCRHTSKSAEIPYEVYMGIREFIIMIKKMISLVD